MERKDQYCCCCSLLLTLAHSSSLNSCKILASSIRHQPGERASFEYLDCQLLCAFNNLIRSHYSQMCLALRLPEIASATRSRSSGTQLCTSSAVDPAAKQIPLNSARANFLTMSALSYIFTLANFP